MTAPFSWFRHVASALLLVTQVGVAQVDVQQLVDQAIARGEKRVALPGGVLKVAAPQEGYHLNLRGVRGFEIDGNQTTLRFASPQSGGIRVTDCHDLSIKNLTLDWEISPSIQGKITHLDGEAGTITFAVDPGFPDDPTIYSKTCAALFYDPRTRLLKRRAWDIFGMTLKKAGDRQLTLQSRSPRQVKDAGAAIGDLVALRGTGGDMAIRLIDCSNVVLSNIVIYSSPGMAIQEAGGAGGNKYMRVTVTRGPAREGSERLLSANADALHSSGVQIGPAISDCRLEYQGDDGIAIHGAYLLAAGNEDPTTIMVSPRYEMPLQAGDRIRLYGGKTYALTGEAKIVSIERMGKPPAEQMQALAPTWQIYRSDIATARFYRVKIDAPLNVAPGDLAASPDRMGSGFSIRNCQLGHNRARGMLIKASDGIIENNTIEDIGTCGIALGPEFAHWLEGDYVRDVAVRNNTLREIGTGAACVLHERAVLVGAISVYALTPDRTFPASMENANLVIENNSIDRAGGIGILIAGAKNVTIRSNTVTATQYLGPLQGGKAAGIDPDAGVFVHGSEDVRLESNALPGKGVVQAGAK